MIKVHSLNEGDKVIKDSSGADFARKVGLSTITIITGPGFISSHDKDLGEAVPILSKVEANLTKDEGLVEKPFSP